VLKRRLDDRLNEKLREARAEVDKIVGGLKEKAAVLVKDAERGAAGRSAALSTGDVGRVRADARAAIDQVIDAAGGGAHAEEPAALTEPPDIGDHVFVTTFGAEGTVRGFAGKQVEIDVRGKRMRVPLSALRASGAGSKAASASARSRPAPAFHGTVAVPRATTELVVVGATVDQAIDRAEKFLDDALLADERRLRVVHGHGTGRLREALTKFFREHPLVASVSIAPEREGGAGATIVELKE
jgi:DNA mismatch repair protein MutS2